MTIPTKKQALFLEFFRILERIRKSVNKIPNKNLEGSGFTILQIEALEYIKNNPNTPVSKLSKYLIISPSSISQLTDRIFIQKLIDRNADPDDRRSVLLSLTKKGERVLGKMKREQLREISALTRYMSIEDIEQMIRIHKNVIKKIEESNK